MTNKGSGMVYEMIVWPDHLLYGKQWSSCMTVTVYYVYAWPCIQKGNNNRRNELAISAMNIIEVFIALGF